MRRFLKLSWHGIPIGIIASILIATVVMAAVYLTVTQTITQTINEPEEPPPPDYGEILAADMILPTVETGDPFSKTVSGGVTVNLGPDGAGKALKMVCTPDTKYTSFDVTITLISRPVGSTVGLYGYGISGGGEISLDLDVAGTYVFDQTIEGTAGNSEGSAGSTVTFTLEDSTTPPR